MAASNQISTGRIQCTLNNLPVKKAALEYLAVELQREESEGSHHPRTCIVAGDVSKEDEMKRIIDTAVDMLGGLDVVSSNAE